MSFRIWALLFQYLILTYPAIRRSAKNTIWVKPNACLSYRETSTYPEVFNYGLSFILYTHWTALALDKSYSPNSLFNREGVIRPAFSTLTKLLSVSLPFLTRCQSGLVLCPLVIVAKVSTASFEICLVDRRFGSLCLGQTKILDW